MPLRAVERVPLSSLCEGLGQCLAHLRCSGSSLSVACQHPKLPGHLQFLALGLCSLGMKKAALPASCEVWARVLGREGGRRALIGLGEAGRGGMGFEQ